MTVVVKVIYIGHMARSTKDKARQLNALIICCNAYPLPEGCSACQRVDLSDAAYRYWSKRPHLDQRSKSRGYGAMTLKLPAGSSLLRRMRSSGLTIGAIVTAVGRSF